MSSSTDHPGCCHWPAAPTSAVHTPGAAQHTKGRVGSDTRWISPHAGPPIRGRPASRGDRLPIVPYRVTIAPTPITPRPAVRTGDILYRMIQRLPRAVTIARQWRTDPSSARMLMVSVLTPGRGRCPPSRRPLRHSRERRTGSRPGTNPPVRRCPPGHAYWSPGGPACASVPGRDH